jgi:LysM repeat protein
VLAWLCAPTGALASGARAGGSTLAPATVTVMSGDSLWSIAREVAPTRDPRAEVDQLRQLNHLTNDSLAPGQTLRTR